MKTVLAVLFISAIAMTAAAPVQSAEPTAQQNKMKSCNADAAGKKADERKAFMKACLSGGPAAVQPKMTQQDKMKSCNANAVGKKGDERKAFMKQCLSAH